MGSVNKVILVGNLGRDAELSSQQRGRRKIPKTSFTQRVGKARSGLHGYVVDAGCAWSVAVVGPTRMKYAKVVSLVDYVADSVSKRVDRF